MRRLLLSVALLTAFALGAACDDGGNGDDGGSPTPAVEGPITPVRGNSELVVGQNRFAIALIGPDNEAIIPDEDTSVRLRFLFEGSPMMEEEARFVFAIPRRTGFFVANVQFLDAGNWAVQPVLAQGSDTTVLDELAFTVLEASAVPNVGQPAISTDNLTLATEPNIKRLSTDEDPDPAFYQMTVTQALAAGKPFVVAFATPAFCETRFCGPSLDNVKEVQPEFADRVNFIHIEPYELDAEGSLVVGEDGLRVTTEPARAWRLLTEPWVFVVDAQGVISARFEGVASPEELREALQAALS